MLVVLASSHDLSAREIAQRWTEFGGALLSCEDLANPGWRYSPGRPDMSQAVIAGKVVPLPAVRGVLTRRPAVLVEELSSFVTPDREYVAAEMNAFLIAFLSSLSCPVLNRPTPTCLSGPNWRPEQWTHAAARLGIPVEPTHRHVPASNRHPPGSPAPDCVEVIVLGERWFGAVDEALAHQAQQLARAANVTLLGVWFSSPHAGARFVGANLWPELTRHEIADAVRDCLLGQVPTLPHRPWTGR